MHQKMGKITEVNIKKTKDDLIQKAMDGKIEETRKYIKSDECIKKIHEGKQGKHIVDHNNFSIHYSKSGTHVVPRKEQNNGKSGGNEKS